MLYKRYCSKYNCIGYNILLLTQNKTRDTNTKERTQNEFAALCKVNVGRVRIEALCDALREVTIVSVLAWPGGTSCLLEEWWMAIMPYRPELCYQQSLTRLNGAIAQVCSSELHMVTRLSHAPRSSITALAIR